MQRSVILQAYGSVDQLHYVSSRSGTHNKIKKASSASTSKSGGDHQKSSSIWQHHQKASSHHVPVDHLHHNANQLVIQVKSCAVSHLDIQVRKGMFSFLTSPKNQVNSNNTLGFVMGYEISGVVVSVGSDIASQKFQLGDHVAAILPLDHHILHRTTAPSNTPPVHSPKSHNGRKVARASSFDSEDSQEDETDEEAKLLRQRERLVEQSRINLFYSSSPPASSHLMKSAKKVKNDNSDDDDDDHNSESDLFSRGGGGYSDYVTIDAHFVVKIPEEMSFEKASSCLLSGIRAYSCLFDHCKHLQRGCSLFVQNGANPIQSFTVQLALLLNLNVWATVSSDAEYNILSDFMTAADRELNEDESHVGTNISNGTNVSDPSSIKKSSNSLVIIDTRHVDNIEQYIMQETGGMGVDAVLLDGTIGSSNEDVSMLDAFISILGLNGTIVMPHCPFGPTSNQDDQSSYQSSNSEDNSDDYYTTPISQLNMAHYKNLYMKNGRVAFLFEQSYVLSCAQQGRYLHMLTQLIQQVNSNTIDIKIANTFPLEKVREAHRRVEQYPNIGKIVLKL